MDKLHFKPRYVYAEPGKPSDVILSYSEFQALLERLEDLYDLAVVAERRNEPTIPAEEFERQLREDGLL